MNTKVILILFLVLLNIAMAVVIVKKRHFKDGFFYQSKCNTDCSRINTYNRALCNEVCSCRRAADSSEPCRNLCLFNPLNYQQLHLSPSGNINDTYNEDNILSTGTPDPNRPQGHDCDAPDACSNATDCYVVTHTGSRNTCVSRTGRDANGNYHNESTTGAFQSCIAECRLNWKGNKQIGDLGFSGCDDTDCVLRCRHYLTHKKNNDRISYHPYPTNLINVGDYDELRDQFIQQLQTDPALREAIQSNLYEDKITASQDNMDRIQAKNTKLGEIMGTLKNLNETGNNFIQQVDQLGEFQDKYSERIEEILDARASQNNNFDNRMVSLKEKIRKLDREFQAFNDDAGINNLDSARNEPYKHIGMSTNNEEIKLNLTPVIYSSVSGTNEQNFYFKRRGAYLINGGLTDNTDAVSDTQRYLHYSKYRTVTNGTGDITNEICDMASACNSWTLNKFGAGDLKGSNHIFNNYFVNTSVNPADDGNVYELTTNNRTNWASLLKKDFFFYIHRIDSIAKYNSFMLKTQGESSLLSSDINIAFPFFIIESARRPGYLLKVKDDSYANDVNMYMDKANNSPDEKFPTVGIAPSGDQCS